MSKVWAAEAAVATRSAEERSEATISVGGGRGEEEGGAGGKGAGWMREEQEERPARPFCTLRDRGSAKSMSAVHDRPRTVSAGVWGPDDGEVRQTAGEASAGEGLGGADGNLTDHLPSDPTCPSTCPCRSALHELRARSAVSKIGVQALRRRTRRRTRSRSCKAYTACVHTCWLRQDARPPAPTPI